MLRTRKVRATFFVLGRHADEHPEIVAAIRADGHEIASHGYDHALLTFAKTDDVTSTLGARRDRDQRRVRLGAEPALPRAARVPQPLRAPGGGGPRLPCRRLVEGRLGHGQARRRQDRAALGGAASAPAPILLLHDGDGSGHGDDRSQTAEAVPQIVDAAHDAGYQFVTVTELAEVAPLRKISRWRLILAAAIVVAARRARAAQAEPERDRIDRHRLVVRALRAARELRLGAREGDGLEGDARHRARARAHALPRRRAGALHRLPAEHRPARARRRDRARRRAATPPRRTAASSSRRRWPPARCSPSS